MNPLATLLTLSQAGVHGPNLVPITDHRWGSHVVRLSPIYPVAKTWGDYLNPTQRWGPSQRVYHWNQMTVSQKFPNQFSLTFNSWQAEFVKHRFKQWHKFLQWQHLRFATLAHTMCVSSRAIRPYFMDSLQRLELLEGAPWEDLRERLQGFLGLCSLFSVFSLHVIYCTRPTHFK